MGGFVRLYNIHDVKQAQLAPLLDYNTLEYSSETQPYVELAKAFKDTPIKGFRLSSTRPFESFSNILYIPDIEVTGIKDFYGFFLFCRKLLVMPNLDTSEGTNFSRMFSGCASMVYTHELDTTNGTSFSNMFFDCGSLEYIYPLDLRKASNSCENLFYECRLLRVIEKLIVDSIQTSMLKNAFYRNLSLETVQIEGTIKVDSDDLYLGDSPNLTVDSLMSFINAFEDNTGEETQYTVYIGDTNLAKLTEEQIAVATNKNIKLAGAE
jgi:hypothetical protein